MAKHDKTKIQNGLLKIEQEYIQKLAVDQNRQTAAPLTSTTLIKEMIDQMLKISALVVCQTIEQQPEEVRNNLIAAFKNRRD